jgi:hypothetical protein
LTIITLVLIGALIVGTVRGGTLRNLAVLRLPRTRLIVVAGVLAALGAFGGSLGLPARPTYVVCTLASAALVCAFVGVNRHVAGMPLVALGFALNALVIVANGAMPVSQEAADFARVSTDAAVDGSDARHELLTDETSLSALADVIPVRLPSPFGWGSNVISAGDIVLAAGIGLLVMTAMRRPGAGRRARQIARGRIDPLATSDDDAGNQPAATVDDEVIDVTDATLARLRSRPSSPTPSPSGRTRTPCPSAAAPGRSRRPSCPCCRLP